MKAKLSPLEWAMTIAFGLVIYGAVMSGVWWLWCFVWSGLWPQGPATLIDPPFLPFVGACALIAWAKSHLGVKK